MSPQRRQPQSRARLGSASGDQESCRRTPSFLYERWSVFRPFSQQNVLRESCWATCHCPPGWWSLVSGLASSHPDDTWGTVEGVGMNKTDRTGERGIFAGSFLKPNLKYTKRYDFFFFPLPLPASCLQSLAGDGTAESVW